MYKALLSYTHFDDQHNDGYLTEFCQRLSTEVQLQTGQEFPIFQDVQDIQWGQDFAQRISEAIQSITFFIPILTPSFLQSDYCREELRQFFAREQSQQRGDLVLPVYYIKCPVLEQPRLREQDDLAQVLAARQWFDWRDLRFEDFKAARRALTQMAEQIVASMARGIEEEENGKKEKVVNNITAHQDVEAYIKSGDKLYEHKDYTSAVAAYTHAIALDLSNARAYINRGVVYFHLEQYQAAFADFERAIMLDSRYANAYNSRGWAYFHLGEYEWSIVDYDRAIVLNPNDARAYINRGAAYIKLRQFERAIEDYDCAIALDPVNAIAYDNRGDAYVNLGQYKRAIVDYDRAITIDPANAMFYTDRGVAHAYLEQYEQAIANYDRAIALDLGNARAYLGRGLAYEKLKQYKHAIADFERAIELDPDNQQYKDERQRLKPWWRKSF